MQQTTSVTEIQEDIVKLLPRGILTIPKKFRQNLGLEDNSLVRIKKDKWRLILEPVCTLPYPVRTYSEGELKEFFALDEKERKKLKAYSKKLLRLREKK